MPPEIKLDSHYTKKVDIYSLGIILFELIARPSTSHERDKLINNLKKLNQIPDSIKKQFADASSLILKMVATNPDDRPFTDEILNSSEY